MPPKAPALRDYDSVHALRRFSPGPLRDRLVDCVKGWGRRLSCCFSLRHVQGRPHTCSGQHRPPQPPKGLSMFVLSYINATTESPTTESPGTCLGCQTGPVERASVKPVLFRRDLRPNHADCGNEQESSGSGKDQEASGARKVGPPGCPRRDGGKCPGCDAEGRALGAGTRQPLGPFPPPVRGLGGSTCSCALGAPAVSCCSLLQSILFLHLNKYTHS